MTVYAIPDIHGHLDKLEDALTLIEKDGGPDSKIIFLGDYIDRGPNSRGVIELLSKGVNEGRNWICLKGNHDRFMEFFLADPMRADPQFRPGWDWTHPRLGGIATLASYEIEVTPDTSYLSLRRLAEDKIPDHHKSFVRNLRLFHQEDGLLFVHAGIRPGIALEDQDEQDLVWIRSDFHDDPRQHPWLIVHGHTVIDAPAHYGNRINLDGGAAFGATLHVAAFEGSDCYLLDHSGRRALRP